MKPTYEQLEQQLAESQSKLEKMAAENANKSRCLGFFASVIKSGEEWTSVCEHEYSEAFKTPATDAFLAEVRASAVEYLLTESFRADIAGALADFDGMDEVSLNTLIWSGQPPEPDGDVWCVEYMTRAAVVQRKLREFAAQIRKGVQS